MRHPMIDQLAALYVSVRTPVDMVALRSAVQELAREHDTGDATTSQAEVLVLVAAAPNIDRLTMTAILGRDPATDLAALVDLGMLDRHAPTHGIH